MFPRGAVIDEKGESRFIFYLQSNDYVGREGGTGGASGEKAG